MPESSVEAVIALGSNLGNRLDSIRKAIITLDRLRMISIVDFSSVYECDAHTLRENEAQPPYLNAVALIATSMSPPALLQVCVAIETVNGRERTSKTSWEARTLDLDIIVHGDETINLNDLSIPHPHLADRMFVLQPLFEIRPDLHIPAPFDSTVQYLLSVCKDTGLLTQRVPRSSLFSPDEFARTLPAFEHK